MDEKYFIGPGIKIRNSNSVGFFKARELICFESGGSTRFADKKGANKMYTLTIKAQN